MPTAESKDPAEIAAGLGPLAWMLILYRFRGKPAGFTGPELSRAVRECTRAGIDITDPDDPLGRVVAAHLAKTLDKGP